MNGCARRSVTPRQEEAVLRKPLGQLTPEEEADLRGGYAGDVFEPRMDLGRLSGTSAPQGRCEEHAEPTVGTDRH